MMLHVYNTLKLVLILNETFLYEMRHPWWFIVKPPLSIAISVLTNQKKELCEREKVTNNQIMVTNNESSIDS